MGLLVEGKWQDQWYDTKSSNGQFVRQESKFRHRISSEKGARFTAESNRYHLYVSLACPWAHRTLIFRKLKNLESHIGLSIVAPDMLDQGWAFSDYTDTDGDTLYDFNYLHQLYAKADPKATTRVTVPVLWDKKEKMIVNNESAEIIRMFNTEFNQLTGNSLDFYPLEKRNAIDELNEFVYHKINNGVYKAGFATTQSAYDEAVDSLFFALDKLDASLESRRYLTGHQITEADWRLFTTLVRFDPVYVGHFKCNLKRIADYPNLSGYLRDLYQQPGIADTVNFDHIKRHYYFSHTQVNPTQIVPVGPDMDLMAAADREHLV